MKFLMFSLMALGLMLTITSCNKDEEVTRNDFIGTWDAKESTIIAGQTVTQDYIFTIAPDPGNNDKIILQGFGNTTGSAFSATISGKNFTTEEIEITINGETGTISGSGTINGSNITYTYGIVAPSIMQTWNGTATK